MKYKKVYEALPGAPPWSKVLIEALNKRGWTQEDLANACGHNPSKATLSAWINGKPNKVDGTRTWTEPRAENLIAVARALRISTDYLLGLSLVSSMNLELKSVCRWTGLSEEAVLRLNFEAIYVEGSYVKVSPRGGPEYEIREGKELYREISNMDLVLPDLISGIVCSTQIHDLQRMMSSYLKMDKNESAVPGNEQFLFDIGLKANTDPVADYEKEILADMVSKLVEQQIATYFIEIIAEIKEKHDASGHF